jgi:hypothetical protein
LQHLLDPNYEPFQKTTKLPPLPAYGADPYSGRAPVDLSQPQTVQPQNQWANPSTTENPPSNGPDVNSAGTNPPMAQAPGLPVEGRTDIVQAQVADLPAGKTAYSSSRTRKPAGKTNYMGTMHVPAADRNIRAPRPAEPVGGSANLQQPFASVSQGRLTRTLSLQPANEPAPLSFRSTGNSLASHATKGLIFIPMPVLAEQKEKDPVFFRHVSYHSQDAQNSANSPKYSGQVKLPPSEENVDTTDPDQSQPQTPSRKPKGTQASQTAPPLARLRISSQPMGSVCRADRRSTDPGFGGESPCPGQCGGQADSHSERAAVGLHPLRHGAVHAVGTGSSYRSLFCSEEADAGADAAPTAVSTSDDLHSMSRTGRRTCSEKG